MNLLKCLQTDGVTILKERQEEEKDLQKVYENGIPFLLDNEHEQIYFVKFADEMPEIRTSFGDFLCFGKMGFEKIYFVISQDGKVFKYDFCDDDTEQLVFANSSLWDFVRSYSRLMAGIFMYKAFQSDNDFPIQKAVEQIADFIQNLDPAALEQEENFWPHQLFVLEDGFAHLAHNAVSRKIGMPKHNYEK
ncbi:hypothetical protein L1281_001058 [Neisseria sp. HSC-16F19]|nr:SUKH-4 family immunity protein [Neisseria sp. HSC-16F19]MCP2040475.1 hypothetical protein [Neisseria sp. HSC-16F19]